MRLHQSLRDLGKFTTETHEMLHGAYGEQYLSWKMAFEWHSPFKDSWVSVEDDRLSKLPEKQ
jgi:hypothetical protein